MGFPGGMVVKNLHATAGDIGEAELVPNLGRSPGGGKGNPLQYSCLENPMDRGVWRATVHGVAVGHDRACTHMHTYRHCSTNWLLLELLAWLCQGWLPGSADVAPSPPEGQHVSWSPWKSGGQKGVLPKARAPHGSGSLRLNSVWGAFVFYFFSGLTYPGKDLGQSTVVSLWTQERETTRLRKELGILNLGFLMNCNKGSFCSISWCRRRLTHTSCHWTRNTLFVDLPWIKDQALVSFFF